METTTRDPLSITEVAVYHLAGTARTNGPLVWQVAADAPTGDIPHWSRPNMRHEPLWPQVAGYLVAALARRVLVVHDEYRLDVLRRHLPGWEPVGTLFTRYLAERVCPGLDSYDLDPVAAAVGINPVSRIGTGAAAEAYTVARLLTWLAREAALHSARVSSPRRDRR